MPQIKKYMAQGEIKTGAVVNEKESPIPGVLTFVDNVIDTTTGTIQLKATFTNADRVLWPGQFLNVVLTLTVEKNAHRSFAGRPDGTRRTVCDGGQERHDC